jgi:hypothetical protein
MKDLIGVAEKPSLLRKYIYEYALIALTACVVFLFLAFNDLNGYIRKELQKDRQEMIRTIEQNTNVIDQFNLIQRSNFLKGNYEKISFDSRGGPVPGCNYVRPAFWLLRSAAIRMHSEICYCYRDLQIWDFADTGSLLRYGIYRK